MPASEIGIPRQVFTCFFDHQQPKPHTQRYFSFLTNFTQKTCAQDLIQNSKWTKRRADQHFGKNEPSDCIAWCNFALTNAERFSGLRRSKSRLAFLPHYRPPTMLFSLQLSFPLRARFFFRYCPSKWILRKWPFFNLAWMPPPICADIFFDVQMSTFNIQ